MFQKNGGKWKINMHERRQSWRRKKMAKRNKISEWEYRYFYPFFSPATQHDINFLTRTCKETRVVVRLGYYYFCLHYINSAIFTRIRSLSYSWKSSFTISSRSTSTQNKQQSAYAEPVYFESIKYLSGSGKEIETKNIINLQVSPGVREKIEAHLI